MLSVHQLNQLSINQLNQARDYIIVNSTQLRLQLSWVGGLSTLHSVRQYIWCIRCQYIQYVNTLSMLSDNFIIVFFWAIFTNHWFCNHKSLISSSNRDTSPIKSVTLFPSFPFLTLKISYISKSFTKDIIYSISIWWLSLFITYSCSFAFARHV